MQPKLSAWKSKAKRIGRSPVRRVREVLFYPLPEIGRELSQPPVGGRDQGFQTCANQPGKDWRDSARGHGGDDGCAVYDGRDDEAAQLRAVHHIDRDAPCLGRLKAILKQTGNC